MGLFKWGLNRGPRSLQTQTYCVSRVRVIMLKHLLSTLQVQRVLCLLVFAHVLRMLLWKNVVNEGWGVGGFPQSHQAGD